MVSRKTATVQQEKPKSYSCAIYTRKSTDENLNTSFNSLDSQREYCQAFIKSREPEGWSVNLEEYTDPGFTGGNMDRPGLKKLISDARQGKFQVVVCYKYDRLSRNTRDFLHILDIFESNGVAFVSVTQPIDTTSSVGRLMRSILVDFSQFEREMISERTRDKMAAMARKGKWIGGHPILGYDYDRKNKLLVVNAEEAKQVLDIFDTYIRTASLMLTAKSMAAKGYTMKAWVTDGGKRKGGRQFNKANLSYLLNNLIFTGKIVYKRDTIIKGEHLPIIPDDVFEKAHRILRANGHGVTQRHIEERKYSYLLGGLVRCAFCHSGMTPTTSRPRQGERYFYYHCSSVNKMDRTACEVRRVPAKALESFVMKRLELLSKSKDIVEKVIKGTLEDSSRALPVKKEEKSRVCAELGNIDGDIKNLVGVLAQEGTTSPRYTVIMERLDEAQAKKETVRTKLFALDKEILEHESRAVDAEIVRQNIENFLLIFGQCNYEEQRELLKILIREVTYDGKNSRVKIALRPLSRAWGDVARLEGLFDYRQNWGG
ncbi:MAG: recombinase family protein [Elusimicrobia bacterium]|nr:recombinase family protein [Elusimicrobiota bacterium]